MRPNHRLATPQAVPPGLPMTGMKFTYRSGQRPLDGYTIKRGIGRGGFAFQTFNVFGLPRTGEYFFCACLRESKRKRAAESATGAGD